MPLGLRLGLWVLPSPLRQVFSPICRHRSPPPGVPCRSQTDVQSLAVPTCSIDVGSSPRRPPGWPKVGDGLAGPPSILPLLSPSCIQAAGQLGQLGQGLCAPTQLCSCAVVQLCSCAQHWFLVSPPSLQAGSGCRLPLQGEALSHLCASAPSALANAFPGSILRATASSCSSQAPCLSSSPQSLVSVSSPASILSPITSTQHVLSHPHMPFPSPLFQISRASSCALGLSRSSPHGAFPAGSPPALHLPQTGAIQTQWLLNPRPRTTKHHLQATAPFPLPAVPSSSFRGQLN